MQKNNVENVDGFPVGISRMEERNDEGKEQRVLVRMRSMAAVLLSCCCCCFCSADRPSRIVCIDRLEENKTDEWKPMRSRVNELPYEKRTENIFL